MVDSTDSKMDVKESQKLQGKVNYLTWSREFGRAAKKADVLSLLKGEEKIIVDKPNPDNYLNGNTPEPATGRPARVSSKELSAIAPPKEDGGTSTVFVDGGRAALMWNAAYKEYEVSKKKVREARDLIDRWVCEGIVIQLEDVDSPVEAYRQINQVYKVSDDHAREMLLDKVANLKFVDCTSMRDYLNKHQQYKSDLGKAGLDTYSTGQMVTNIFVGLPQSYRNFKKQYDWNRASNGDKPHDIFFLTDRLLMEEQEHVKYADDKKKKAEENSKKQETFKPRGARSGTGPNRDSAKSGRSDKKCTFCDKIGHPEEKCWTKYPDLMPKALKERGGTPSANIKSENKFAGLSAADVDYFKTALAETGDPGTTPTPARKPAFANFPCQAPTNSRGSQQEAGEAGGGRTEGVNGLRSAITALAVGEFDDADTWLVDSGCNMHIVNNKKWFDDFRPLPGIDIATADGSTSLRIHGGGSVSLDIKTPNGKTITITLKGVAYAPNGSCNLIALSLFAKSQDVTYHGDNHGMTFVKNGKEVAYAALVNGLFHLEANKSRPTYRPMAAVVDFSDPVWKWHRRLGHLSFQNMRNLLKFSSGMDITDKQIQAKLKAICPICATTAAIVRIPRDPAKRHSQEPGRLIHADTWGPYSILGIDETKYMLFFTDDATRFTWSARLTSKGQLPEAFRSLHKRIERSLDIKIRNYRIDGEFSNGPVGTWLEKHGIGIEPTTPYDHYQNGVAERNNRTIREKAAPMIQETALTGRITEIITERGNEILRTSSIPESLWPEAMEHSVWLKNRSPARALRKREKKTPWEALYGDRPSLGRERIWGSTAYVTLPHEKTDHLPKLHSTRGWPGYYMGSESESIYRVYSPDKKKVFKVGVARVEDGQGLMDPHSEASRNDRIPPPVVDVDALEQDDDSAYAAEEEDSDQSDDIEEDLDDADQQAAEADQGDPSPRQETQATDAAAGVPNPTPQPEGLEEGLQPGLSEDGAEANPVNRVEVSQQHDDTETRTQDAAGDKERAHDSNPGEENGATTESEDDFVYDQASRFFANVATGKGQKRTKSPYWEDDEDYNADAGEALSSAESELEHMSSSEEESAPAPKKKKKRSKILRYFPDDSKCNFCFIRKGRCDRELKGGRCSWCIKYRRVCVDQTPETRALVKPEDRGKASKRLRLTEDRDRTCHHCMKSGRTCQGPTGPDNRCSRCRSHNINTCRPATAESLPKKKKEEQEKTTKEKEPEKPKVEKCHRCTNLNLACNGETPCNKCTTIRVKQWCTPESEWQKRENEPRCNRCEEVSSFCDRQKPCGSCKRYGKACYYAGQEGLVVRGYPKGIVTGTIEPKDVEDDDRCGRCYRLNLICNKGEPCHNCVILLSGGTRTQARCIYTRPNGFTERWSVPTHHIEQTDAGPMVALKPNWKSVLAVLTKGEAKEAATTGATEAPPVPMERIQDTQDSGAPNSRHTGNPVALQAYNTAFPDSAQIIPTPANAWMCAPEAVRRSWEAQHPSIEGPTVEELQEELRIMMEDEDTMMAASTAGLAYDNWSSDQTAATLHNWGRRRGLNVQLGYVIPDGEPTLVVTPDVEDVHRMYVWIHNDDATTRAEARKTRKGKHSVQILSHWSGLRNGSDTQEPTKRPRKTCPSADQDSAATDGDCEPPVEDVDNDIQEFATMERTPSKRQTKRLKKAMAAIATHYKIDLAKLPDPQSYAEAMRAPDAPEFKGAMKRENNSLEENKTYVLVPLPPGERAITSKYVYKRKIGRDGKIKTYKARLVARGFQQREGIDYVETFAAVVKPASYRILFAIAAALGWKIHQMDVKTAFLNGNLDKPVYMKPPAGMKLPRGLVLMLQKALYGLCQSPRAWYDKFRETMEKWGWTVSAYDPCIFINQKSGLILCLWVDDILIFGKNEQKIVDFKEQLSTTFSMTDEGECSYYLGMHIEQKPGSIFIHQTQYVNQMLERYGYQNLPATSTPGDKNTKLRKELNVTADPEFKTDYMSKVGSLNFLCNQTRPDTSFQTGYAARYGSNPNQSHMDALEQIFAYVGNTQRAGLHYRKEAGLQPVGYVDSDFANCEDSRKSTTGYIFTLAGAPISWSSKRQATIAQSTMDAEYIAAAEAARDAVWIRNFINDLKLPEFRVDTIPLLIDNNCALKLTRNPEFHARSKHIDVKYHFIREKVMDTKEITTARVDTKDNLADLLTKTLPKTIHQDLTGRLGIWKQGEQAHGRGLAGKSKLGGAAGKMSVRSGGLADVVACGDDALKSGGELIFTP